MKKFQTYFCKAKLIIPFCLFSLFFVKSFSQDLIPYEEPLASRIEKSKQVVLQSEFIFQGKFISESVQHTSNHDVSIIRIVFLVQHVYKGDLKLGKVILEYNASVGHFITEKQIDINGKEYESRFAVGFTSHSEGPNYSLDKPTILFCNVKKLLEPINDSIDNKKILEFANSRFSTINYGYNDYKDEKYELGGLENLLFKVKADFNKFLQEGDKTIVLPPSASERAVRDSILHQPQRERNKKFIDSVNNEKLKRYNDSKGDLRKNSGNINYSISNQKITTTGTERFYEFDVYSLLKRDFINHKI